MKHVKLFEQYISEKEEYKVAGRPVTLNKGEKEDGTDWTVTFKNGDTVPLSDVLANIKPFPKGIKESIVNETTVRNFRPVVIDRKNALDEKFFKKLMPRTANTTDEAMERIWMFEGGTMFEHYQYHVVKPNGNKPDRPTYRIHQRQCWLNDGYKQQIQNLGLDPNAGVNATLVTIFKLKDGEEWNTSQGDAYEDLGKIWVDTKVFLDELSVVFEVIKRAQ